MKTILVAIDFSAGGRRIVAEAVGLARVIKARLIVLHVVQPPPVTDVDAGQQMSAAYAAMAKKSAAGALVKLQKILLENGITVQTELLVGPPGPRIVERANELRADFVVLGSHGHGALYDLMVGRTASHVLKHAACPVVIVPRRPGRPPGA